MEFSIQKSLQILHSTPRVLRSWLPSLHQEWIVNNEGDGTWSVKEVVAHLIVCEKTNWMVRAKIILEQGITASFTPIDMNAHFDLAEDQSIIALIDDFSALRSTSIIELTNLELNEDDLERKAIHPVLGEIRLRQLLSTWVGHDLSHIAQLSRIMAMQYREEVGPFNKFLKFINKD